MNPNTTHKKQSSHKMKIDWAEPFRTVCIGRKLILKVCSIGAVMGLIIALGTPKEYTASMLVAHEGTRRHSYSDISALADMTGDMNTSVATERDALYPSLYSSIVNSTPFLLQLYDIRVNMLKDSTAMNLTQYLKGHQKTPWWNVITSAPTNLVACCLSLFKEKPKLEKVERKVEKVTPVYTVIQPVTVPLGPSKPNKMGILAGCILLSAAGGMGWVLFTEDFIRRVKKEQNCP